MQDAVRDGLRHCRHPWVVRLDADNAMTAGYVPRALEQLQAARQKDPRVALLYPEIHYFLEDWSPRPVYPRLLPKPWNIDLFHRANYIDAGSLVWRPALDRTLRKS